VFRTLRPKEVSMSRLTRRDLLAYGAVGVQACSKRGASRVRSRPISWPSREFFDGFAGPYIPDSDISPIFNPEFFGNTIVVNGRTWPLLEVEPRRYRFRFMNGCNSRWDATSGTATSSSTRTTR